MSGVFVEHLVNGDIGEIVEGEDGRQYVDVPTRPTQVYYEQDWRPLREIRPLTPYHLGLVCFEADKAMCLALGKFGQANLDWRSPKVEREMWIEGLGPGPKAEPIRRELYAVIEAFLRSKIA